MFNNLLVLPKSKVAFRSKRRRLGTLLGRDFGDKWIGGSFPPIRHNWAYGFQASAIQKVIDEVGLGMTKDAFAGMMGPEVTVPDASKTYEQRFLDEDIPRIDSGLKAVSLLGTIQFLIEYLFVGSQLGFDSTFFTYTLLQIANTEAVSYAVKAYKDYEVCGNSIFGYTNHLMVYFLWLRARASKGGNKSWLLSIFTFVFFADFIQQFFIPMASKGLHTYGLITGMIMWGYLYGFKYPPGSLLGSKGFQTV